MNILHVLHAYPPSMGGIQHLFQNISERLTHNFGDGVTVYTTTAYQNTLFWDPRQPALPHGETIQAGVRVRRFPVWNHLPKVRLTMARVAHKLRLPGEDWWRSFYFGPIVPGLMLAIYEADVDVVVAAAFPLLHMHVASRAARRAGVPLVLVGALHPEDTWCFERANIYQTIRHADAYIALSKFERDYILGQDAAPQGDARRIHVCGGGVDAAIFAEDVAEDAASFAGATNKRALLRQQWGWGIDDPAVIFLGRHAEHKRIDVLLAAMQLVWHKIPETRLLIAGARTSYTRQLEAQVAALPHSQQARVTWVVDFDEAEKPALLAACDVLANPSAYESFGLVFVEAWAAGLPVIGARVGAISTLIEAGRDGLLVTYKDPLAWAQALLALVATPALRIRMGIAGREKVRATYTWPIITQRFRDVYTGVMDHTYG